MGQNMRPSGFKKQEWDFEQTWNLRNKYLKQPNKNMIQPKTNGDLGNKNEAFTGRKHCDSTNKKMVNDSEFYPATVGISHGIR